MPKGEKAVIDYDKIYNSQYDGKYKIIKDLGLNDKGYHKVLIQFLETSNIQEAILYRAQRDQVRDQKKRIPEIGIKYQSNNFGPFIFLELLGSCGTDHNRALIQFTDTGTIKEVELSDALNGNIRDQYRPIVYGVGCLGNTSSKCREYPVWHGMVRRCYDIDSAEYIQYGAKGVSVCKRWLCFEFFLNDVKYLPGYDLWLQYPGKYEIDKDTLQMHIPEHLKIYSPQTCCFIDKISNIKYASKYQNQFDNTRTSKYMGVSQDKGKPSYRCAITVNGHKYNHGSYKTQEAAAFMYDYVCTYHHPNIDSNLLNNIPNMTLDDAQALRSGGKNMCKIIHK